MVKKILFPLIAIFLAYRSYEMVKTLWYIEASGINILIQILFSILLNLFITGIFAFMGFAYKTSRLLGENYYRTDNPHLVMELSKLLKIESFKKFLIILFWGKGKNRKKYFDGTRWGLDNFEYQTRQSEFGHFSALIAIQIVVILIIIKGHYVIALMTTLINAIFNYLPILLQRNHRIQIDRIRKVLNKIPTVIPSQNSVPDRSGIAD
ncbi:MAG: hypothetical protein R6V72_17150 [Cyclobacterium sp.]|uniref:glycosyl-4,4'-diaponeurosporenoate acyltransferase CrtO family protein n=1 Tax=Cyclobacterium sp. TaxID=1966343 RepID=UPI003970CB16